MGFSSFCAPIFCILLNYPRFDGIYRYVDSSIMLELYTSKCAMQELVYISYFLYFEEKSQKLVFEYKNCDQVRINSRNSLVRLDVHTCSWDSSYYELLPSPCAAPVVFFASAFGTKKLASWMNWSLVVLSDYLHSVCCFKGKVKTRLLDLYSSTVVSFLIKKWIIWLPKFIYLRPNTILIKAQISF